MTETIKSHENISGTVSVGPVTSTMGDYRAEYTAESVRVIGPAINGELVISRRKDAADIASLLLNYE